MCSKCVTPANVHKLLLAVEGQISLKTVAAAVCKRLEEDSSFQQGSASDNLAVRNSAVKQLWGRTPLPDASYLLDKNPLNWSESHPMPPSVFGTKSPKCLISQQECDGLRSAGRSTTHTGLRGRGRTAGVGSRGTCCSLLKHGDCFIELVHCCSAAPFITGLYCLLASSLQDDRAGDRLPTPETRAYPWRVLSTRESYGLFGKSATSSWILKICSCNCAPATCIPSPSPPWGVGTQEGSCLLTSG